MESIKTWLKKNWSTALILLFFGIIIINPNAKIWVMKQLISTGIMNSKIEDRNAGSSETSVENFSVTDSRGSTINTSELKGKVVFINFWASWCPPCRAEFPSVQEFYNHYKNNPDLVFLTVNLDDQSEKGRIFLQKEKYTLPLLTPTGNIPAEIFSGSLPTTVVLDKNGKLRLHHSGMADYSKSSFYSQIDDLLKE